MQLVGRHKGDSAHVAIISPDWDFNQMGIGGLDKEFSDIFRRAFASRVFPPDIVEQLGMKHVRGILLFGPPGGCGHVQPLFTSLKIDFLKLKINAALQCVD